MRRHSVSIAVAIAVVSPAWATAQQTYPAVTIDGPPIQRFYVAGPLVDGFPTFHAEWRVWDGRRWLRIGSDEGDHLVYGIKPILPASPDPRPPIPKHQRRME